MRLVRALQSRLKTLLQYRNYEHGISVLRCDKASYTLLTNTASLVELICRWAIIVLQVRNTGCQGILVNKRQYVF